jgi:5'-nucleotidase / UDP-sugar diphosphatase
MGYSAAAIGNHDFDFGLEALRARATEAHFPFLSANTRYKSDGRVPTEWGIQPFTVVESNGVRVGIIGLTTTRTRTTTNPANIAELEFGDYETAVREFLPQAQAQGAELFIVIGHLCEFEMRDLAARIPDLPVAMIGGGHCNELFAEEQDGAILLAGGSHLATFAGANLTFDTSSDELLGADYGTGYTDDRVVANAAVAAVVARWQAQTDEELEVPIGYTQNGFPQRSLAQQALITETWLWGYPTADIALTNMGGFRAAIRPGEITFGDVVGVFPFNNVLVAVELTGEQVVNLLTRSNEQLAVGGMREENGRWLLNKTNQPLENRTVYTVLVNDFMYAGGSGFGRLAQWDPNGYNTAIDWRQPLIDWLVAQDSSPSQPVDAAVAGLMGE